MVDIELRNPVRPEAARPGDLVFVTGLAGDPLSELIQQLDGSPYTHVGVADGEGRVLSARTGPPNPTGAAEALAAGLDLGGVRADTFEALWARGRDLVLGRTAPGSGQEGAVARFQRWVDTTTVDNSAFSYVKLLAVATGLRGARPDGGAGGAQLVEAAERVARSWAIEHQRRPSFYCAEAVAIAFGHTFTRGQFPPPLTLGALAEALAAGPEGWSGPPAAPPALEVELPSPRQALDLIRLLGAITVHDPTFLATAIERVVEIIRHALPLGAEDDAAGALAERNGPPDDDAPLPMALVTPRMLLHADWVEWLAPIAEPE